jgi:spore germination protein GerM
MTRSSALSAAALVLVAAVLAWLLFVGLPRWYATSRAPQAPAPTEAAASPAEAERKIKARLFYVSDDGRSLTSVEREVPYGADSGAQAKAILEAQMAPAAEPLLSAVPSGTRLRAVFVANGEAYVDVTGDVISALPGGSLNELLTVYTLVGALTANLPAVNAVQILVDGKEVDTLTGHVDLRQPLTRNPEWVQ